MLRNLLLTLALLTCSICDASPVKLLGISHPEGWRGNASCVHIGQGVFLTAQHCFYGSAQKLDAEEIEVSVYGDNGESYAAHFVGTAEDCDLAWFTSDYVPDEHYELRPSEDYLSVQPFTLHGWEPAEDNHMVEIVTEHDGWFTYVERQGTLVERWNQGGVRQGSHLSCNAHQGNSGGAIVDANGYLIGIVSSQLTAPGPYFYDCLAATGPNFIRASQEVAEELLQTDLVKVPR